MQMSAGGYGGGGEGGHALVAGGYGGVQGAAERGIHEQQMADARLEQLHAYSQQERGARDQLPPQNVYMYIYIYIFISWSPQNVYIYIYIYIYS
jgi:hypothetical protein